MEMAELRIVDASLNRAGEGLRVIEDFVRFVLDDPFLTTKTKELRHDLAAATDRIASSDRHAARDTNRDVGTSISHDREEQRADAWDVCAASLKRTEQALRSLEEYGKLIDSSFARQIEALRYQLYTLEKAIDVGRSSRERLADVRLCVLLDGGTSPTEFDRLVRELVEAGVGMIQLRDKQLDDRELIARARQLRQLTIGTHSLCVINDRPDIAAAVHADGVHLGQEDLTVKDARAIVGPRMLMGVSTHNIDQARAAVLDAPISWVPARRFHPRPRHSTNSPAWTTFARQRPKFACPPSPSAASKPRTFPKFSPPASRALPLATPSPPPPTHTPPPSNSSTHSTPPPTPNHRLRFSFVIRHSSFTPSIATLLLATTSATLHIHRYTITTHLATWRTRRPTAPSCALTITTRRGARVAQNIERDVRNRAYSNVSPSVPLRRIQWFSI